LKDQAERIFFKRELNEFDLKYFAKLVDPNNSISPFNKFVGNRKAIKKLSVVAYNALQKDNHICNEIYFSLIGPPSAGKTTLVKLFAEILRIPLVEISPRSIKNIDDFFYKMYTSFKEQELPLTQIGNMSYKLPASIVFIDEVHALKNNIVQGLLKATEKNDAILITESGYKINCKKTCWIIATTDIGKIFDAFKSRFSNIELTYLTKEEISKVVKINHPQISDDVCDLVARYNPMIPRKALEFARYMILYKNMYKEKSWDQVASEVADSEGIDELGMTDISIKVLKFLHANVRVASKRLEYLLGKKMDEIEKYILPTLICGNEQHPPLVAVTRGGLKITDSGIEELRKRKILQQSLT
jgi:Holliday junction resolvasome RuvABC ATP-dependent DNA helicase subunit